MENINNRGSTEYDLLPEHLIKGCRVVVKYANCYNRAEVISGTFTEQQTVKLFFIDYGTVGYVKFTMCKKLTKEYALIPNLAYRAGLHGIEPAPGKKLWSLETSFRFVSKLRNLPVRVEIVDYHRAGDFYEVKLFSNHANIAERMAEASGCVMTAFTLNQKPNCIIYPPFEFMEQADFYPTLGEREYLLKKNVDFNQFEEENVDVSVRDIATLREVFKKKFKESGNPEIFQGFKFLLKGYLEFPQ